MAKDRLKVAIEVEPFLGKVWIKMSGVKGFDRQLMIDFLRSLESATHLYTLKERMRQGYKLADCRHPKKRLVRRKHGIFCLKCGAHIKASKVRQRAQPIIEIKKAVAKAPVRRLHAVSDL